MYSELQSVSQPSVQHREITMVNVVMVARDRHKLTTQALASLMLHTKDFNVTLFDDGSDPPLTWSESDYLTIFRSDNTDTDHVLGAVKNLAVKCAQAHYGRGDWLYLSDNDVYFTRDWFEILVNAYEKMKGKRFLVLGGQNHPYHMPISEHTIGERCKVFEYGALAGTSMLMKWSTWDKFGPFLTTSAPGVCQGEDHAFSQVIREAGGRVGAVYPHVVLDTGLTQTGGTMSPGWDIKERRVGVLYE